MKREHIPAGYDPTLDRRQPEPLRIAGIVIALAILFVMGGLILFGVAALTAQQQEPVPTLFVLPEETEMLASETPSYTPTFTRTPTPDAWGRTGTALSMATVTHTPIASITPDYCYWLTPTATHTPTLPFTPDAWARTGTAIYQTTNPYRTPTPGLPRELCTDLPQITNTPTFTPFPIRRLLSLTPDTDVSPAYTLPVITPPSTWTPVPTQEVIREVREVYITSEPPAPVEILITSAPVIIQLPPIVITATSSPTLIPSNTSTATATLTSSPTSTSSPTATSTATSTSTATETVPTETVEDAS
jgi:hypothetical protein